MRKRKEREEQETERVRLKVRRKEAVATFQALLVETIKDPQVLFLVNWFYILGTLSWASLSKTMHLRCIAAYLVWYECGV